MAGELKSGNCYSVMEFLRLSRRIFTLAGLVGMLFIWPGLHKARAEEKVFIFNNCSRNLEDFKPYAALAERLKPYGRVEINISALADKSWYEMPPGGSPWHEYAAYVSAPWKFYPHPAIAPYLPADWVAANRKLLLDKAALARQRGLGAAMASRFTHLLPESFFTAHPEWRGPRVDHPRRSKKEAFAWCVDLPEVQGMVEWMMAEFKRNIPEIQTVITGTNDAGAGICWAAAQYAGPNGPAHCKSINAGERVRALSEAIHRGALQGGGDIDLRWGNVNFWQNETYVILPLLPPRTVINSEDPLTLGINTLFPDACPITGLLDPLALIMAMEKYREENVQALLIGFSQAKIGIATQNNRTQDSPETLVKLLDVVEECLKEPTQGLSGHLARLRKISALWGGDGNADKVFKAFYDIHQAFELKQAVAPGYSTFICAVSLRHLTRPLVIKPELLKPEEEAYFLPHVFNIHENEARTDYIDSHGGRMTGPAKWDDPGLRRAFSLALSAARTLDGLEGAPEGKWLKKLGLSLRMWVSEIRSIHNFYHGQLIRDANKEILAGLPRIPAKEASWYGDKGNLEWNEIMRDEFDNTNELIAMLENGGLELVVRAEDPRHEDTFLLGPDLVGQLKKKAQIIRAHWLDIQDYLAPPLK